MLCQEKASDFFKNPSQERDILKSLFDKNKNKNKAEKGFTLAGEVGALVTTGNTTTSMFKLALDSNHELENWSNRYESQLLRRSSTQKDEEKIETTRIELSAQFDYKLQDESQRLFAYVEYDDNQFNRLRNQSTVVFGYSKVAWKEKNSELRYSIGPGHSRFEQERNNLTIEEMIIRGTLLFNLNFGENARFRQVLSAELGEEITKARLQSSITAKIYKKLALKFSINLMVNDNVADEDETLSTQTSISMVYQFF